MTTIHLDDIWSTRLSELPESGMGYQRVDFVLKNHRVVKDVMVFNAEDCESSEPFEPADILDVKIHKV